MHICLTRDVWKMVSCLPKNGWNCKPNLNSLPDFFWWFLSVAFHISCGFSFFANLSTLASSSPTSIFKSTTASSLHLHNFFNVHAPLQFFVRLRCLLTLRSEIRHKMECFMTKYLETLRCFWFQSVFNVIASLLVT